jgi:hypothetical protein
MSDPAAMQTTDELHGHNPPQVSGAQKKAPDFRNDKRI